MIKQTRLLNFLVLCSLAEAVKSGNLRQQKGVSNARTLASCADGESSWKLDLTVDDFPWETRWTIKDTSGERVVYGPSDDTSYEKRGSYEEEGCLSPGNYVFTMKDRSGDGMCCKFGDGQFQFKVDDVVLAKSDDSAFKKLEFPFTLEKNSNEMENTIFNQDTGGKEGTLDMNSKSPSPPPTKLPTMKPTAMPVTSKPSNSPSTNPTNQSAEQAFGSQSNDSITTQTLTPSYTPNLVVSITPFSLFLATNEEEIDIDELGSILTQHLFEEMKSSLPKSTEISKLELSLTDVTDERNLVKDENAKTKRTSEDNTSGLVVKTHEISISGDVFFGGSALPTTEQLDEINAAAFMGDSGEVFIQNLLTADDNGLQSTVDLSLPTNDSDTQYYEDYLTAEQADPSTGISFTMLYVVGAIAVVGLLLVATIVYRVRRKRSLEDSELVVEEENVRKVNKTLPKCIDAKSVEVSEGGADCKPFAEECVEGCGVNWFFDAIQEAPSQASTEVASNQISSCAIKRQTINAVEEGVTHTCVNSNKGLLQKLGSLYQTQENEVDVNQDLGVFCGLHNAQSVQKPNEKSRFGMGIEWGLKPVESEDTSVVQNRTCNRACS